MNEQLQAKMVEILASIQSASKAAGDFALEQLPDIAQSYVLYGRVQTLIGLVGGLCVVIFGVFLARAVKNHIKASGGDLMDAEPVTCIFGSVASSMALIFGASTAFNYASAAALVWLAPKVWLLKELASLVK